MTGYCFFPSGPLLKISDPGKGILLEGPSRHCSSKQAFSLCLPFCCLSLTWLCLLLPFALAWPFFGICQKAPTFSSLAPDGIFAVFASIFCACIVFGTVFAAFALLFAVFASFGLIGRSLRLSFAFYSQMIVHQVLGFELLKVLLVLNSRQQSLSSRLRYAGCPRVNRAWLSPPPRGCFHRVNSCLVVGVAKCYTNKALASQRDAQDERGKPGSRLDTM